MAKQIYFSGFNGIRGAGAFTVLVFHIFQNLDKFGLNPSYYFGSHYSYKTITLIGNQVLNIFFAISGFLITYLLLAEKDKTGDINIKKFYIRRALRIWPLYYLYIFVNLIVLHLFKVDYPTSSLWMYLLVLANIPLILGRVIPLLAHYWTLGAEEQYYLFLPLFIKKNKKIIRNLFILLIVIITVKWASRIIAVNYNYTFIYNLIKTSRYQCTIIGSCFAAMYYYKICNIVQIATNKYTQIACWIGYALLYSNHFHFIGLLDDEFITAFSCLVMIAQIEQKNRIINLENKYLDWLGKITYGMYVWHPLICFLVTKVFFFKTDSFLNLSIVVVACVICSLLVAHISFEYYEKWFLKLKINFTTVQSAASRSELKEESN